MTFQELQDRHGNPVIKSATVSLFYDRSADEAFVLYESGNTSFVLNPPKFLALDCYCYPREYFEAEMRGISNPKRLVPAAVLEGDFVA